MNKNHTLIFDFDGTIADTFHYLVNIANRLSHEFGFQKIETHEVMKLKDKTVQEIIRYLGIPFLKIPMIVTRAKIELHKEITHVQPAVGLKEILHQFKLLGFQMGILTSNSLKNVNGFLKNNDLELFDFIRATPKIWSKNRSLKTLMNENQLTSAQTIYIGDETRDIIAAEKAGIRSIAVTWGYNSHKALKAHHPDYLIHSPHELLQLFK